MNALESIMPLLSTATELTEPLKVAMFNYFTEYQQQHPGEAEDVSIVLGVLDLHSPATRRFLKYSDFELLTIARRLFFYRWSIECALKVAKFETPEGLILSIARREYRISGILDARERSLREKLTELETVLEGVHGSRFDGVRLENHRPDEGKKLDLMARKDETVRELTSCKQARSHIERVGRSIASWLQENLSETERHALEQISNHDTAEAALVIGPYIDQIAEVSGMNRAE